MRARVRACARAISSVRARARLRTRAYACGRASSLFGALGASFFGPSFFGARFATLIALRMVFFIARRFIAFIAFASAMTDTSQ